VNVNGHVRARARASGLTVLVFGVVCGLLAESIEVVHIQAGGVAPPGWPLRGALLVAYGVVAAALLSAALLVNRRRAVALAATGVACLVVLPWLNFSLLPRFDSVRSLLGNAAAVVLIALLVPLATRLRRTIVVAIALLGLGVNLWPLVGAAGRGGEGRTAPHAALPFNVMVVLIDTLRADHLGAYGYERTIVSCSSARPHRRRGRNRRSRRS